jgi:hypothetical protein
MRSVPKCHNRDKSVVRVHLCGGGVEYLHRDPASRRRRRNGKSQIWDSKMWSRVSNYSNPRKTTLARASSICKRQTRPLVREGAPQKQDRNCQRVVSGHEPQMGLDVKTYWLTDRQSQCDFDLSEFSCEKMASRQWGERGSWRISTVRSSYQETTSGDYNRLGTLVCVCEKVSSKVWRLAMALVITCSSE